MGVDWADGPEVLLSLLFPKGSERLHHEAHQTAQQPLSFHLTLMIISWLAKTSNKPTRLMTRLMISLALYVL